MGGYVDLFIGFINPTLSTTGQKCGKGERGRIKRFLKNVKKGKRGGGMAEWLSMPLNNSAR